ncbi:hypothetical protein ACEZEZ_15140 [Kluyvera ascorbata]|uniref:hypothetical protein n=1 Tax=Kluyvera ascorbata TaxID=51288 RepID=UPI0035CCCEEF
MTVSKRGRVPKSIQSAVQEQFTHMGERYSTSIKWSKQGAVPQFMVFRLTEGPDPVIYTFAIHNDGIHYTSFDVNTCESLQLIIPSSEDAFFQFMFKCDLPLIFDAFTEIMNLISSNGLSVTASYK